MKPRGLVPTLDGAMKNIETIKRMRKLLKRLEWLRVEARRGCTWLKCPVCLWPKHNGGVIDTHSKRCALAKLLKETEG